MLNDGVLIVIKRIFRNAIIRALMRLGTYDRDSFVLCYHDVDKDYKLTPEFFEYQIRYYLEHGYKFISEVGDLRAPKRILITFDDGYESFECHVLPLLERYRVPCIVFVPTKYIGKKMADGISEPENQSKNIMSFDTLKRLAGSGLVGFGCHTHSHFDMTRAESLFIRQDIEKALSIIRSVSGKECRAFCYPQGKVNDEVKALINEMGFEYAFTTKERAFSDCDNYLEIPRYSGDYFLNELFLDLSRNSGCNLYLNIFSK